MACQTETVQIVVAFSFGECIAILEAIEADHTLPSWQIAIGQMLTDDINQIEHHRTANRFGQFRLDGQPNGGYHLVIETARIPQVVGGPGVRIAVTEHHLQCHTHILAIGVFANCRQHHRFNQFWRAAVIRSTCKGEVR